MIDFKDPNGSVKHLFVGVNLSNPPKDDENYFNTKWFVNVIHSACNAVIKLVESYVSVVNSYIDYEKHEEGIESDVPKMIDNIIARTNHVISGVSREITFVIGGENVNARVDLESKKNDNLVKMLGDKISNNIIDVVLIIKETKIKLATIIVDLMSNEIYDQYNFDMSTDMPNPSESKSTICDSNSIVSCIFRNISKRTTEDILLDRCNIEAVERYRKDSKAVYDVETPEHLLMFWNCSCKIFYSYILVTNEFADPKEISAGCYDYIISKVAEIDDTNLRKVLTSIAGAINTKITDPSNDENNKIIDEIIFTLNGGKK